VTLDGGGFNVNVGIQVLVEKAAQLVTADKVKLLSCEEVRQLTGILMREGYQDEAVQLLANHAAVAPKGDDHYQEKGGSDGSH